MRTREVVAVVVGTALLVSCSSPQEATPAATLSPAPPATAAPSPELTSTEVDTAVVPDEITSEYVEAVMDDLDAAMGSIFRAARDAGEYGEAWQADMRAIYTNNAATQQTGNFIDYGFGKLAARPQDPTTEVEELIEATPTCLFFTAIREVNPLLRKRVEPVQPYYLALALREPEGPNPTTWKIAFDSYFPDGGAPRTACGGEGA